MTGTVRVFMHVHTGSFQCPGCNEQFKSSQDVHLVPCRHDSDCTNMVCTACRSGSGKYGEQEGEA